MNYHLLYHILRSKLKLNCESPFEKLDQLFGDEDESYEQQSITKKKKYKQKEKNKSYKKPFNAQIQESETDDEKIESLNLKIVFSVFGCEPQNDEQFDLEVLRNYLGSFERRINQKSIYSICLKREKSMKRQHFFGYFILLQQECSNHLLF
ncbi:unnamed protein product [Paramecium primaurelia]|uniref:Uncharacterized protein n=1 Tax=Paramecium primaurelia TaxID=5886 RepID=A0A8S1KGS0_PARPR|nr:unnamed protein product [Paramecium primaurelia]